MIVEVQPQMIGPAPLTPLDVATVVVPSVGEGVTTRYFIFGESEESYEEDLMDKLLEDPLPFQWTPPRAVSFTITGALHEAAMIDATTKVSAQERSKKRTRVDEEEGCLRMALQSRFTLLKFNTPAKFLTLGGAIFLFGLNRLSGLSV